MKTEEERLVVSNFVARIFGIIMVVLYMALGTTIIIKAPDQQVLSEKYAVMFGGLLIAYGFFRAYKVYRNHFAKQPE